MSWKAITTHPLYEVSDAGEVRNSVTGKMMKHCFTTTGYRQVGLYIAGIKSHMLVHRLVAIYHIENPENKPFVDHIDRNRTNNHTSNLRWATRSENGLNTGFNVRKTDGAHYITPRINQTFQVRIQGRTVVSKTFDTLEEAVAFRDQWMADNPR